MAYVRNVKTKSGATAVQVAFKRFGQIVSLNHIDSAHSEEELQVLLSLARQSMLSVESEVGSQRSLFDPLPIIQHEATRALDSCWSVG